MNKKMLKQFPKMITNKTGLSAAVVAVGIISTVFSSQNVYAHGFVENPGSRVALCSEMYGSLNLNCGEVMYEPQSLEAPKGFPEGGPIDGKIASAGGLLGGF